MKFAILLFASALAYAQTARFPGAIATDTDLTSLTDRAQTQLSAPLNSSATSFTVVTGSKFSANMILTIDGEQIKACSVVGNTVNVGHASCPNVDGRGFAGTVAASHNTGALVSDYFTAYQFKALREEIKSIEGALGPNLSNVPGNAINSFVQVVGGSLTAGSNVVTLAPVPAGVNGTDTDHRLWFTGTLGTNQACLIAGGTAVADAGSGTVIVTCAGSLSGTLTAGSATAGIQEVIQGISTRGAVPIPAGFFIVHAPITVSVPGATLLTISGAGIDATVLARSTEFTSGNIVQSIGTTGNVVGLTIRDLTIYSAGYPTPSHHTSGAGIAFVDQTAATSTVQNVKIQDSYDGILISGSDRIAVYNVEIFNEISYSNSYPANSGITIQASGIRSSGGIVLENAHIIMDADDDANGLHYGIRILACDGVQITDPDIKTRVGMSFENSSVGIANVKVDGAIIDRVREIGVNFAGAASVFTNIRFNNYHIVAYPSTSASRLFGVVFYSPNTAANVIFNDGIVAGFPAGFEFGTGAARKLIISNSQIYANVRGIQWQAGDGGTIVTGNQIYDGGAGTQLFALDFSGAVSDVLVAHNNLAGNLSAPINGAASVTSGFIGDNTGYNPVGVSAITPGASPYTYTAGPSPETICISGGTVSLLKRGSTTVATASPAQITLPPFGTLQVTYSVVPTMIKDVR
jgi:hypothetical protein